jgi:uncharacterized protein (TIGR03067 family)
MMRRTLTAAAALLLLLSAAMLHADNAVKGDKDLDGDWEVKSALKGGKEPPADAPKLSLTIQGDVVTMKIGPSTLKAAFKAYPDKKPKAFDMTPEDGPHKGETIKGIYEVTGDEFRVCHGDPGQERPTEFSGKDDDKFLIVWKRVKK